jgi:hypothetical protein
MLNLYSEEIELVNRLTQGTKSNNNLLKGIFVLLLAIVLIVGGYVAIGLYWAEHQKQLVLQQAQDLQNTLKGLFPTYSPQNPAPTYNNYLPTVKPTPRPTVTPTVPRIQIGTTYGVLNGGTIYRITLVASVKDSPSSVTFTTDNILYNGKSGNSYGDFAPQLYNAPMFASPTLVSQLTLDQHGGPNTFEIKLIQGQGGPWVSGTTLNITIQTNVAQGSIIVTLP